MKTQILSITLLLLFSTASLFAQPQAYAQTHKNCKIPNLTEQQQTKIDAINLKYKKDVLPLRNEIREMRAKITTLTTQDNVNLEEVYALIDAIAQKKAEIEKKHTAKQNEIRNLLTEEQQVVFDMHKSKSYNNRSGANKNNRSNCRGQHQKVQGPCEQHKQGAFKPTNN